MSLPDVLTAETLLYGIMLLPISTGPRQCPANRLPSSKSRLFLYLLSSVFSNTSALFCATEPSQPLSHQELPHSFPCNGGERASSCALSLAKRNSPLPAFLCFQRLTHCPLQALCFDNVATVTRWWVVGGPAKLLHSVFAETHYLR